MSQIEIDELNDPVGADAELNGRRCSRKGVLTMSVSRYIDLVECFVRHFCFVAGLALLNQSVLLRGVNGDVETMVALSNRLLEVSVLPYYLHQLDRVTGVGHFEVARETEIQLIAEMRKRLSGYAVPRYVKEEPGEPNKTVWA